MTNLLRICVAAALCILASPAAAADTASQPATAPFSLPGIDFVFPLPDGYCLPTGPYDAQAKLVATADHANLTDVAYYVCADMASGAQPSGWGMVKTPLQLVNSGDTTRQQMIDYFKTLVNPDDLKKITEAGEKIANEGLHDTFGTNVNVTMDLKPLQTDANAAYMGGLIIGGQADGSKLTIACVYATTVVKNRVFLVYLFRPYQDPRDITDLLAGVKTATANFIATNGG